MALTAYRVLILDSPTKGVVCGGNAMVHCVYSIDTTGGVVCNSCADEVVIPVVVPPQPETILCFKFRPGEKIFTCDLRPVIVISVRSIKGSNIYKVGMYGRVLEFYEYELCSPSMAASIVHELAEKLSKKSIAKLENTPVDPPLPVGKACKKIDSPNKSEYILAIQEKAQNELDKLRALREEITP